MQRCHPGLPMLGSFVCFTAFCRSYGVMLTKLDRGPMPALLIALTR